MAITEKQRREFFKQAEEVFGPDGAETLMSMLPPVGWADVTTKHDLDALGLQIRAEFSAQLHKELRQQLVAFLTANTILLGVFTTVGQLLG